MKTNKLSGVIITAFLLFSFSAISGGCMDYLDGIRGDGNVVKEERPVKSFSALEAGGAFEIVLKQGNEEALTIEADENILPHIISEVRGGVLVLETDRRILECEAMKAYITFKKMDMMDLSGAVDLLSDGKLTFDDLRIVASGASEIGLDLTVELFEMDLSGASEVDLSGYAEKVMIEASGASELDAADLETNILKLEVSGASDAVVMVNKELDVEVSGAASVRYKGDPDVIHTDVSGASSLKKY